MARTFRFPFHYHPTVLIGRTVRAEVEWVCALIRRCVLPFESDGTIVQARGLTLPLETLTTVKGPAGNGAPAEISMAGGILGRAVFGRSTLSGSGQEGTLGGETPGRVMPVEWGGGLLWREYDIPLEFREGIGRLVKLPIEFDGEKPLIRRLNLPVESRLHLIRALPMPVEVSGLVASLVHRWNVRRPASSTVLHQWTVLATIAAGSLLHEWIVLDALNPGVVHTWRVLPGEIVTLYSSDIQLPYGSVEITP